MRPLVLAFILVASAGFPCTASANICAFDVVPASTLLFPLVTYEYGVSADTQTTLIAITNVSSEAQIVHLTVWTDFSIAILDFNIVLTGYDVQTINIRDILLYGLLPNYDTGANIWWDGTGESNAGPSPFDNGPYSSFNALWGGALDPYFAAQGLPDPQSTNPLDCDPATWISSPNNYTIQIPQSTLTIFEGYLRASETSNAYRDCTWANEALIPGGTWWTDPVSRPTAMYITADVVGACNKDLPDSDAISYFGPVVGVQTANVLIGDLIYLDKTNDFSEAEPAVHLEATSGLLGSTRSTFSGNEISFYHRYHGGVTASPREPLPTAWALRYLHAESFQARTWIRAWKGSTNSNLVIDVDDTATGPGGTISGPSPDRLYANTCIPYTYYVWDEDENVYSSSPGFIPPWSGDDPDPVPVPNLLPLETQEVPIDEFQIVFDQSDNAFGWMMFIWPLSNYNGANPNPLDQDEYQTWMAIKISAFGRYTAGMQGAVLANYNCDDTQVLPRLGIGLDTGFPR
jgi:hypothetical protein